MYTNERERKMENRIVILGSILTLGIFIINSSAIAGQQVKVFELAESGQTIEFLMTPQEIAAEDAEKVRLNSIRETNLTKPEERLHVFEMAESGQTFSFPMSPAEITAKDAEKAKSNVSAIKINRSQKRVIQFELSESGEVIEFPAPEIEAVVESTDEIIDTADKTK
jgi:hypothetical protein